ncbi:MAG: bifunctional adenosylcobinamide kinase/adenosylcobinamide-phosphate guanylyltransferase [Synergistaceae bacterium]|nr:bifunctional adenosylcobinamide kinase/adenosylcobinamide-phosphate guanylyltransferase [Synergistaceae bacterium]
METKKYFKLKSEITLILGGARSGKSTFAEKLAMDTDAPVTYLAAADAYDSEMQERIAIHKKRRPPEWKTFEGDPYEICCATKTIKGLLLLDCLTLWITRLFLEGNAAEDASEKEWQAREAQIRTMTEDLCSIPPEGCHLIIVSNEVGYGLVPSYKMGRRFRDLQGRMNQLCASRADRAALIVAGYPVWLKGGMEDNHWQ